MLILPKGLYSLRRPFVVEPAFRDQLQVALEPDGSRRFWLPDAPLVTSAKITTPSGLVYSNQQYSSGTALNVTVAQNTPSSFLHEFIPLSGWGASITAVNGSTYKVWGLAYGDATTTTLIQPQIGGVNIASLFVGTVGKKTTLVIRYTPAYQWVYIDGGLWWEGSMTNSPAGTSVIVGINSPSTPYITGFGRTAVWKKTLGTKRRESCPEMLLA